MLAASPFRPLADVPFQDMILVGAAGLEPTTCSTQNCRATRLRYTPISQGNDVDTRLRRRQQGARDPFQWPLKSGCPTRSPGSMPYFFAVPAITSSTPFANPPDGMIFVDSGSVFPAILRIPPSPRLKIIASGMWAFFLHLDPPCFPHNLNQPPLPPSH